MTEEMHKGIQFLGKTMSKTVSETTTEYAEATYSFTGGVTTTTSCPPPTDDPDSTEIGYFVWVVDTDERTASAIQ